LEMIDHRRPLSRGQVPQTDAPCLPKRVEFDSPVCLYSKKRRLKKAGSLPGDSPCSALHPQRQGKMKEKPLLPIPLLFLLLLAVPAGTVSGQDPVPDMKQNAANPAAYSPPLTELHFGVTPYLPEEILISEYEPLMEYLSSHLGIPVRLVVAGDYDDLVKRLERSEVDLAALTPLSYVRAKREDPSLNLLLSEIIRGTTTYTAYIIVHRDSGIDRLEDLRGKRFVFVDLNSASGYLFPYAFFLKNGIAPETFFKDTLFSGNHVEAIRLITEKQADAAAISSNSLTTARDAGIRTRSLRIFKKTGRIPHDTICARAGLDPELTRQVRQLLLDLDTRTEQGRRIFGEAIGINGWVQGRDKDYAPVREVLDMVEQHRETPSSRAGD
jgi:phosphate/phosphite/phosphonate ABC transporter binding protein